MKISPKSLNVILISFILNGFLSAQVSVLRDQNNAITWENQFALQVKTENQTSFWGSRGLWLGDCVNGDCSTNIFFNRWTNNPSFNIYGGSGLNDPKYLSIGKWGDFSIYSKDLVIGDNSDYDLSVRPISLKSIGYDADQSKRWLMINPYLWSANGGVNAFSEGTYLNSRVLISDKYHSDSPVQTNQNALLSVDGNIFCEGLKVKLSENWADYVFEDHYELASLDTVEAYIKENHHLPGIPSASVIEKEGIDIANIQKLQMEKIEELTLYIIEQNKQILELKQSLNQLIQK